MAEIGRDSPCPFLSRTPFFSLVADWTGTGSLLSPEPSMWPPSSRCSWSSAISRKALERSWLVAVEMWNTDLL